MTRWKAVIIYRSEHGNIDVEYFFDEIADLDDIIESGPHWDTLVRCVITRGEVLEKGLTVEAAASL